MSRVKRSKLSKDSVSEIIYAVGQLIGFLFNFGAEYTIYTSGVLGCMSNGLQNRVFGFYTSGRDSKGAEKFILEKSFEVCKLRSGPSSAMSEDGSAPTGG